jgi:hypothetical protein
MGVKNRGGRPPGAKNKVRPEVRVLLARLEKEDKLHFARIFQRLEEKALSNDADAIPAARLLLSYAFGSPRQMIDISQTLEAGESWTSLLLRVTQGDSYRREIERLDEWRRQRALAITTTEDADPDPS